MKEVLVLRDLDCIKAIAHPRRVDILKTFNKEPLSAKQLSEILDEPHAKINYHIKTLYNVGILQLVEENKKLKEQKNTNKDSKNGNNFDKICEMLENKYELKIKECSEERPKQNVFESFFNAILKEEK